MGTRHLICVVLNGEYKVAQYGQWDGYPSGQGLGVLGFLEDVDMGLFREKVSRLAWASEEHIKRCWVECGADPNEDYVNYAVGEVFGKKYPEYDRDTGSRILDLIMSRDDLTLYNDVKFAQDSLFCEWCYVIDLDANKLEVYKGFNREPLTETDRFYTGKEAGDKYQAVKLIYEWSLDDLPGESEFIELLEPVEEE